MGRNEEHKRRDEDSDKNIGELVAQIVAFVLLGVIGWTGVTVFNNSVAIEALRVQTQEFQKNNHRKLDRLDDAIRDLRNHPTNGN